MKPKVGIIGDGNVGSALRRGLERAGYHVRGVGKSQGQAPAGTELVERTDRPAPNRA